MQSIRERERGIGRGWALMSKKCIESICEMDNNCKCATCPNVHDCILCYKFGCINHVVESEGA
jgi:hypothetical protein